VSTQQHLDETADNDNRKRLLQRRQLIIYLGSLVVALLAICILEFVGLGARAGESGDALPYGEQRLLEVAVALAAGPKLLLLDEPVSGMNPVETESFMAKLADIRALGITVLLVEHDMKMVMGVSDRIVCLSQGRAIARGTPAQIQRDPEVIRAYLGERYARDLG
jgi:branched-chain amino acid transport system ATP-binding protein